MTQVNERVNHDAIRKSLNDYLYNYTAGDAEKDTRLDQMLTYIERKQLFFTRGPMLLLRQLRDADRVVHNSHQNRSGHVPPVSREVQGASKKRRK